MIRVNLLVVVRIFLKQIEQILLRLNKQNKESVERLKKKREKEIMDDMKEFEDPQDLAYGGVAGLLGERTGYLKLKALADY